MAVLFTCWPTVGEVRAMPFTYRYTERPKVAPRESQRAKFNWLLTEPLLVNTTLEALPSLVRVLLPDRVGRTRTIVEVPEQSVTTVGVTWSWQMIQPEAQLVPEQVAPSLLAQTVTLALSFTASERAYMRLPRRSLAWLTRRSLRTAVRKLGMAMYM